MPFRGDLRSVTIPGCVDGWIALHERFGLLDLDVVLTPAIRLAAGGFPADRCSPSSSRSSTTPASASCTSSSTRPSDPGAVVRRPGVALTLQAIARGGRDAFYGGAFGEGLVHRGAGLFTEADLEQSQADWVDVHRASTCSASSCARCRPTRRAT